MSQSAIRESSSARGRTRGAQEKALDELARFGLIYADPDPIRLRWFSFDRDAGGSVRRRREPALAGATDLTTPTSLATRLALVGAGTIASLAVIFG